MKRREIITWAEAQRLDALVGELRPHQLRNELRYQLGLKISRHVPTDYARLADRAAKAQRAGVMYRSARSAGALRRYATPA